MAQMGGLVGKTHSPEKNRLDNGLHFNYSHAGRTARKSARLEDFLEGGSDYGEQ